MLGKIKPNERAIAALKPSDRESASRLRACLDYLSTSINRAPRLELRYRSEGKNRWKHLGRVGVVRLGVVIETAKRDMAG
jgi:hypothetical protein